MQDDVDIVFAGDSITYQGFWSDFFPEFSISNQGIGSDISEGLLNRVQYIIERNPEQIFLMVGTNDLGLQLDSDELVSNVEATIKEIHKELPEAQIYLQSILPTNTGHNEESKLVNQQYEKIANSYDSVTYIDLYPLYEVDGNQNPALFQEDGVHLNGEGYEVWIDAIEKYVNK